MTERLTTYSPKDVICTIAGMHTAIGYADGTFIRIRKNSQSVSTVRAMDGTTSRVYSPDTGFTLELTLMQSSTTNDILSTFWNVDATTRMGKFPVMVKDSLGTSMFMAATCWVAELPDMTFANELSTNTWVIACEDVMINLGGSGSLGIEGALGMGSSALPLLKSFGVF